MNAPMGILAPLLAIALLSAGAGLCREEGPREKGGGKQGLHIVRVDSLERVYPDSPGTPAGFGGPISVPRNAHAAFQFALRAPVDGECEIGVAPVQRTDGMRLAGDVVTFELVAVPVEANNNGGSKTQAGVIPPPSWLKEFVPAGALRGRGGAGSGESAQTNDGRDARRVGGCEGGRGRSAGSVLVSAEGDAGRRDR